MPRLSATSITRLKTCHINLQLVVHEAIKEFDFMVICGERSVAEQQELYAQGRTKPGKIVTNIDGVKKKSNHNYKPSRAVDLVPYPVDWNNIERFKEMGAAVKRAAAKLNIAISWGGDWKSFKDYPHFELV